MTTAAPTQVMQRQRWRLLRQISALMDVPMTVLAFAWLGLLMLDFTQGLTGPWEAANYAIWALFIAHFCLEFVVAPQKKKCLRRNWPTAANAHTLFDGSPKHSLRVMRCSRLDGQSSF